MSGGVCVWFHSMGHPSPSTSSLFLICISQGTLREFSLWNFLGRQFYVSPKQLPELMKCWSSMRNTASCPVDGKASFLSWVSSQSSDAPLEDSFHEAGEGSPWLVENCWSVWTVSLYTVQIISVSLLLVQNTVFQTNTLIKSQWHFSAFRLRKCLHI